MKLLIKVFFIFIFSLNGFGQLIYYQDVFHGGVTVGGFSTGLGTGSGTVNLYIEPGSGIKKAFIFTYSTGGNSNQPIEINGINYIFDSSNVITFFTHKNTFFSPIYVHCVDITLILNSMPTSSFTIDIHSQAGLPYKGIFAPFIYVAYSNLSLPICNTNIIVNNQKLSGDETYTINNLNSVNTAFPVGFSIYSDRMTGALSPYFYNVFFNAINIGSVGYASDNINASWGAAGVKGHFYYQNNTLFGLDDDTPDALMDSTDGLADVISYLTNNTTFCNFELIHNNYPNNAEISTGVELAYFLTYTTPCDTFSVKLLTEDTTVCRGQTVQLGVSGGNTNLSKPAYEWLPHKDLSCYDCANPIFSGDSSQVYTVRIWNTDSCSKVLPVRVKVFPPPAFGQITRQNTVCGAQSGSIAVASSPQDSLFFNNNFAGLTPLTLSNLGAGTDTLFLKDTNGCVSQDTLVTIESTNNTQALFTVNPQTGAAPLSVTTDNQSTNATDYLWYFLNDSTTVFAPNIQFDTSGTYTVTLVAYQNDIACADTFSLSVTVYDSLQIIVPNIFTPNGDGQNDVFSIQVNAPCQGTVNIFNRWGNEVFSKDFSSQAKANIMLWNGLSNEKQVSDGVYFYQLHLTEKAGKGHNLQGFVSVVR